MTATPETQAPVLDQLVAEPTRFALDAAMRLLLMLARTGDAARAAAFVTRAGLAYPPGDVLRVDLATVPARVEAGVLGLTGVSGVLPWFYAEHVMQGRRDRSPALHAFLDMLGQRMMAGLAQAGTKYRLDRAVETARIGGHPGQSTHEEALLALAGFAGDGLVDRLAFGRATLLHYAGVFALRPRSASRLVGLVSDWLGLPVRVVEFTGGWLPVALDQRSRMPSAPGLGKFNALGVDTAIGAWAWDPQGRITLVVGPLDRATFESLLPNRPVLQQLVALVRAYLGFEVGFAVNLVLKGDQVPTAQVGPGGGLGGGAMLGWNSWAARDPGPIPRPDATEARFDAETVEAYAAHHPS